MRNKSARVKKLYEIGQIFKESHNERSEVDNEIKKLKSFLKMLIDNVDK